MLVVHAAWAGDALTLWAEDPRAPAATASRAAAPRHPYACDAETLRGALAAPAGSDTVAKADPVELELRLPGSTRHPLPSPELGPRADAPAVRAVSARRWLVPALALRTGAHALLAALDGAPREDFAIGAGLRHLVEVRAFAEHLVDTARLAPLVTGSADAPPAARWRPLLTGSDAARFADLAAALPPVAHAHLDPATPPPAGDQVFAALAALVDEVARDRLAAVPPSATAPWTDSLTGADTGPHHLDEALATRLRESFEAAHRSPAGPRLLLRLTEPEPGPEPTAEADEVWRVELWIQSAADPSLQLPLRDLWNGEGGAWLGPEAETTALRDLARAARHYRALAPALDELAPAGITLGRGGAYTFIRDAAPRLTAAGFAVVLPEWAGRPALTLTLATRERPSGAGGGIGAEDLVDFSFSAVLGGEPVDTDALAELARLKQPLVRVRGRWVEVDPASVQGALDFLRRRGRGRMRRSQALELAVSPEGPAPVPIGEVDADGALGALLSGGAERSLEPMATPPGFGGALRPYQERGAAWLRFLGGLGLGAVLADDMGLGKTVQLLALLADEHARGAAGPTLMICPVSLVGNWQREAGRFAPGLRVRVHHGPDRAHGNDLARLLGGSDLVVTTYGVVTRDVDELAAMPWRRVVCDEAQAIKNSGTRQARAVRELKAEARIALTGTPVENNLGELWSIMEFANPGLLGSAAAFDRAIAATAGRDDVEGSEHGTALLKRLTGPFILRRLKTDRTIISDLPEKHEMRTWCTLTPEQASLYKATVDEMTERIDEADGIQRKGLVLATMARLKQICNHPAQFLGDGSALEGRSGKLDRLERLLAEAVSEGDKALCFTQYTAFGDRLAPYLAERLDREVLWLHGGTPRARREELMRRFQESAEPMVFLLSLKAAGTGLNLTAANHVVHVDRWWNPAVEDQATDRAFRIGQRRDVQVRKLICVGTLEERVDEMIERKKALAERVVGTGEEWLAGLSTAELREVVRLAPEAVTR
ncbi:DEAD/DEAH box helicase [Actinorugispora endophytica]|uniref:SNF2 family DNA or RNA helicase n=1 Tax=Actinorugispora endophytica TaxID=1605990 RepID=A0A4R6UHN5_9ACTN|nr:DEAD/DEAH box helicase [Actinorugispora endophytica]TDQ46358.1 SNF2 family DNA or RNA helicase [Actinorugispora endophytica]